jgi:hypothetical protein
MTRDRVFTGNGNRGGDGHGPVIQSGREIGLRVRTVAHSGEHAAADQPSDRGPAETGSGQLGVCHQAR